MRQYSAPTCSENEDHAAVWIEFAIVDEPDPEPDDGYRDLEHW